MSKIHPTAIVDAGAELASDVEVGAFCIIEGDVSIGAGSVIRSHSIVRKYTTLGEGNFVDSHTTLGGEPQDLKFDRNTKTFLNIGNGNTFRESVTISRATGEGLATTVGNNTYWMAASHAGHNTIISDNAILVNAVLIGGHSQVGKGAIIAGGTCVHQHVWIGQGVISQGGSATGAHVPPFCILSRATNRVSSLNIIGLRRTEGVSAEQVKQVREGFELLYRRSLTPKKALGKMDELTDWSGPSVIFREFIRKVINAEKPFNRPLCRLGKSH